MGEGKPLCNGALLWKSAWLVTGVPICLIRLGLIYPKLGRSAEGQLPLTGESPAPGHS